MTVVEQGHRLKLKRAKTHLDSLKRVIRRFLDEDPYYTLTQYDPDTDKYVIQFRVRREAPDSIGLLVGDCVHNLRSSLDQLTWQLALVNTAAPFDNTQFPICRRRRYWRDNLARIPDLSPVAQRKIEGLQPYHGRNGADRDPLYLLHQLWNYDKHRAIPVLGTHVVSGKSILQARSPSATRGATAFFHSSGPYHHGDQMGWLRVMPPMPANTEIKDEATFDVAFEKEGPGRGAPVVTLLTEIYERVRDEVFPTLEPLLT